MSLSLYATSLAQIASFSAPDGGLLARNWRQTRTQSGSGQTDYGDGVLHLARDIYLPPGSQVRLPFAMVFDHVNESNEDGTDTMGYVYVFVDGNGRWWRFIHIAKAGKANFMPKLVYPAGTFIGTTSLRKLGNSPSHLHLDVGQGKSCTKGGSQCIDPLVALGVAGWNTMVLGTEPATGPDDPAKIVAVALAVSAVAGVAFVAMRRLFDPARHG